MYEVNTRLKRSKTTLDNKHWRARNVNNVKRRLSASLEEVQDRVLDELKSNEYFLWRSNSIYVQSYNFKTAVSKFSVANAIQNETSSNAAEKTSSDKQIIKNHIVKNCTKIVYNGEKIKIGRDEIVAVENSALIIKDNHGNFKRNIIEYVIDFNYSNANEVIVKSINNKAKLYIDKVDKSPTLIGKHSKWLQIFFRKRLSREDLESRGIYKDEPIFGNTLEYLHSVSASPIPIFVRRCIERLERMKNITTPGLYRSSGNAAVIQTIRVNVDANRIDILDKYRDDPDVLAGALKMFFRELKKSLIDKDSFERLAAIYKAESSFDDKLEAVGNEINSLSESHRDTLNALSEHLLNVARYETDNQMNVKSLAICWGPSVITFFPEHTLRDGMLDLIHMKNAVFEMILMAYDASQHATSLESADSLMSLQSLQYEHGQLNSDKTSISNLQRSISTINLSSEDDKTTLNEDIYKRMEMLIVRIETKSDLKGVYKKDGDRKIVAKILKKLDKSRINQHPRSLELLLQKSSVHDLTAALKQYYVKRLVGLVMPQTILEKLLAQHGQTLSEQMQHEILNDLQSLPLIQQDCIKLLFTHLAVIIEKSPHDPVTVQFDICKYWTLLLYQNHFGLDYNKAMWAIEQLIELYDRKRYRRELIYTSGVTKANFLDDISEEGCENIVNCMQRRDRINTLPYIKQTGLD